MCISALFILLILFKGVFFMEGFLNAVEKVNDTPPKLMCIFDTSKGFSFSNPLQYSAAFF